VLEVLPARHVWAIDFEFEVPHDVLPGRIVCMVARDLKSGAEIVLAGDELKGAACPFRCDGTELFVAFYASAEAHCFLALGWPLPPRWIDLWAEERRLTNGRPYLSLSLIDTMTRHGLRIRDKAHKTTMQTVVGTGRWSPADLPAIVSYCREDVEDTAALLVAMLPWITSNAPVPPAAAINQAILRGRFMAEVAAIERRGIPWDVAGWARVNENWERIQRALIANVDAAYGVFDGTTFVAERFARYLERTNLPWPRLPSGALALDRDTFRHQAKSHAAVAPLRELRGALSLMRGTRLAPDDDGRVRTRSNPYRSKTGRSQPSSTRFAFGSARWTRSFIMPGPGRVFAYLDYRSQEIAIAAHLAGDAALIETYESGDPYLAFAKRAGMVPRDATKESHPEQRGACKVIVLGVQYGMEARTMAAGSGMPVHRAEELLQRHREAYPAFWSMAGRMVDRIGLGLPAYTAAGWRYQVGAGGEINPRSSQNWIVQSTGADIMRLAVIRCAEAGLPVVATVHDALALDVPEAGADEALAQAAGIMSRAAADILGGPVGVDVHAVRPGERYVDEAGHEFFRKVMQMTEATG